MGKQLTEKQEKLLNLLFEDEFINNPRGAMRAAGYSDYTTFNEIVSGIKESIIEKTDQYLALHAAKAVQGVLDVLDNSEQKGAKARLEAASMILDRVGITKKERLEVEHKGASGILIIPAKKEN